MHTHTYKTRYLRFTDLSSLIKKVRNNQRKAARERLESGESPRATKSGLMLPRREFHGITLPEFESESV